MVDAIRALDSLFFKDPVPVEMLPTWEQSIYSPISPSIRTRQERVRTLGSLHSKDPPKILVSTIAACAQGTISRHDFSKHCLTLHKDKSVGSREDLAALLRDAGYTQVDPAEDPGTFSIRGDIVDIFPANRAEPFRVELFGDQIERIRAYDPETQRTNKNDVDTLFLSTAREVLVNEDTAASLRTSLKNYADDVGIPRPVRDPIIQAVHPSSYPERSDTWAAFAIAKPATLFDHLDESWAVVWSDELSCQQSWDAFLEEQEHLANEARVSQIIAPPPAKAYLWTNQLEKLVESKAILFLDKLEFAVPNQEPQTEDEENAKKFHFNKSHC